MVREREREGDVHRRRNDIVRRLAAIDVVVGVHRPAAAREAEDLTGTIGDHLVDVHVGLRARAGLPDRKREVVVVVTGNHFASGRSDGLGDAGIEESQIKVDPCRGTFHARDGVDQWQRHAVPRRKVVQCALGLRAPQRRGGDFDWPEAVVLGTGVRR